LQSSRLRTQFPPARQYQNHHVPRLPLWLQMGIWQHRTRRNRDMMRQKRGRRTGVTISIRPMMAIHYEGMKLVHWTLFSQTTDGRMAGGIMPIVMVLTGYLETFLGTGSMANSTQGPNDENANDQQDLAHHLYKLTLDERLHLAPIGPDPHVRAPP